MNGFHRILAMGLFIMSSHLMAAQMPIHVRQAKSNEWMAEYAATELARYLGKMTGQSVDIITPDAEAPEGLIFELVLDEISTEGDDAVGSANLSDRSSLSPGQKLSLLPGADDVRRLRDGFVIESKKPTSVVIGAVSPVGLMYGVYNYLQQCCGVGFFWDGEHVPTHSELPTENLAIIELPRWPVRMLYNLSGFGLDKWHQQYRSKEQREQIIDWFAKRQLNWCSLLFGPEISQSGIPAAKVFGLRDDQPTSATFGGWPGVLDYPAPVFTKIIQDQLAFSRQRGIRWMYSLTYGTLPMGYDTSHPEYQYLPHASWSSPVLDPDEPAIDTIMEEFYRELIDTYGTDHYYDVTPYPERAPGATLDQALELKIKAAQKLDKLLTRIDPKSVWVGSSWDFAARPELWTPERIKAMVESVPKGHYVIFDSTSVDNPFYKANNYFSGSTWWFGNLHSFQGDDELHGDLVKTINAFKDVSNDLKANHCEGICLCPESMGHNVLYYDMQTYLAWNPDITLDDYLTHYVQRRFGLKDQSPMRAAVDSLVKAVYGGDGQTHATQEGLFSIVSGGNGQMPIYEKLGCGYGPQNWWPIVDEHVADHPAETGTGIADLHNALKLALACETSQKNNTLYENDMVDWMRTYLAHIFNAQTIQAYQAFKKGDVKTMNASIEAAEQCLTQIEQILSTRPDFSLQRQIEQVMKQPGMNPWTPWYMKQHSVHSLYATTEGYEIMHFYYAPRMNVYFNALQKRAAEGVNTITWADIAPECATYETKWLNESIKIPQSEKFEGTPMDAINHAWQASPPLAELWLN